MIFINHLARGPSVPFRGGPLPELEDVKMSKWQLEAHRRRPRTEEQIEAEREYRRSREATIERLAAIPLAEWEEGFRDLRAFVQRIGREEEVDWDAAEPPQIDTDRRNLCTALFLDCRRPGLITTVVPAEEAIYEGFSRAADQLAFEYFEQVRGGRSLLVCVPDHVRD